MMTNDNPKLTDALLTPEEQSTTFQSEISVRGGGYWEPDKLCEMQHKATIAKVKEVVRKVENYYDAYSTECAMHAAEEMRQAILKELE